MGSKFAAKIPITVKKDDDPTVYAKSIVSGAVCPIFSVSNVTGEGLPQLKAFLSAIKSRVNSSGQFGKPEDPIEFLIDGTY